MKEGEGERDGLTCHWMPRIGPLKGDPGGGDKGGNQSSASSTRAELGPIKSESIFVERPIKPLENLIDCRSPIRERERAS